MVTSQTAFNIRQAADLTGFHRNTISQAIRAGILPAKAYGHRRVVILRGDIDRWLGGLPEYPNNYKNAYSPKCSRARRP
jgi:excisionase family DNA binding protein